MFVLYFRINGNGNFLYGEGRDPRGYGGTPFITEAAKFKSAKQAREIGEAYARMCGASPSSSEITVLRQV